MRTARACRRIAVAAAVSVGCLVAGPGRGPGPAPARAATTASVVAGGEQASGLSVGPAVLEEPGLQPGHTVQATVSVGNATLAPMAVTTGAGPYAPADRVDSNDRALFDTSSWFSVSPAEFTLPAGAHQTVVVTIAVPDGAEPGGHYATVLFQPRPIVDSDPAGTTKVTARIGVIALLTVAGPIHEALAAAGPVHTSGFRETGPTTFSFPLRNTGTVHVLAAGHFEVFDWRHHKVGDVPIPAGVLLPGTVRTVSGEWDRFRLVGPYTVRAVVDYNDQHVVVAPGHFWAFPLRLAGVVVGMALVLMLAFLAWRRRLLARRPLPSAPARPVAPNRAADRAPARGQAPARAPARPAPPFRPARTR